MGKHLKGIPPFFEYSFFITSYLIKLNKILLYSDLLLLLQVKVSELRVAIYIPVRELPGTGYRRIGRY